jgi:RNA polymerase sigma-70 factor, ECF subfamily
VQDVRTEPSGSDAALMVAFAEKDERAAGVLYDRFASRIYGLGMVMLGNDQAAQDLVQDTFVKLWRTAARFDPDLGRLETWILLAARSLAIDSIRRRLAESRAYQAGGPPREDDPTPGPDEVAVSADLGERARRAMTVLSPEQRSALELAYFGGRTTAEVAALEGIPLGTAKTRIHHALLRLRKEMGKENRP